MAFPICHFPASQDTGSKIGGCGFYTLSGQTKFPNKIPTKFPSKFHCLFLGGSNAEDKLLVIQDVTISGMLTFQHFCSKQIETKLEKKKKNITFPSPSLCWTPLSPIYVLQRQLTLFSLSFHPHTNSLICMAEGKLMTLVTLYLQKRLQFLAQFFSSLQSQNGNEQVSSEEFITSCSSLGFTGLSSASTVHRSNLFWNASSANRFCCFMLDTLNFQKPT